MASGEQAPALARQTRVRHRIDDPHGEPDPRLVRDVRPEGSRSLVDLGIDHLGDLASNPRHLQEDLWDVGPFQGSEDHLGHRRRHNPLARRLSQGAELEEHLPQLRNINRPHRQHVFLAAVHTPIVAAQHRDGARANEEGGSPTPSRSDDPGGQHLRRLRERLKESSEVRNGSITNDEALAAQQLNKRMLGISQESVGV